MRGRAVSCQSFESHSGGTARPTRPDEERFQTWQDKVAIAHGELWEDTIKKGISESVFFIPIITPTAVKSRFCKFEFETFLTREKELGRSNLVFPILYIPVPALADDGWRQDPVFGNYRQPPVRAVAEF